MDLFAGKKKGFGEKIHRVRMGGVRIWVGGVGVMDLGGENVFR